MLDVTKNIFLLIVEGNCVNFSLELFIFYSKSPSDLKTASQNRPNTYGPPCTCCVNFGARKFTKFMAKH